MTGRSVRGAEAGTKKDRRSPAGQRVHFEAMVAVGGSDGGFEAESVDLSHEGMRLRTAYLPAVGEKLVCRFDGIDGEIVALGDVLWTTEQARGGEFAVRFVELDEETVSALKQLIDIDAPEAPAPQQEEPAAKTMRGTRVKLHIEGLASPMKARVKEATSSELRVGSSLEFLKLGRHVDVEDVDNASRREGFVDAVRVEIDPSTSVPQLVVSLRFDAIAAAAAAAAPTAKEEAQEAAEPEEEVAPATKAAASMKPPAEKPKAKAQREEEAPKSKQVKADPDADESNEAAAADASDDDEAVDLGLPGKKLRAASEKAAKVTSAAASAVVPALSRMGAGARDLFANLRGGLEKRRHERAEAKKANAPRRVTAPPPSGALTSEGKRLVRQESEDETAPPSEPTVQKSRRGLAIGAAAGLAVVVGVFGISRAMSGKSEPAAPVTAADVRATQPATDMPPVPGAPAMGDVPLFGPTPLSTTEQVIPPAPASSAAQAPAMGEEEEDADESKATKKDLVREWGNGEVEKPRVLKVRMDGPVSGFSASEVEGGFNILVPGRKSLSTSTALVRKDKRISSLDVIPREEATEINVRFKGEPPAYLVKVRSDRVEIALGSDKKGDDGEKTKKVAAKKKGDKKKK
ncbi:MAG: PilZ domain-containing protein [Myxococcales bacterium]|nr:PilZ domain-containing protein [Myxococcales bacterium]